MNHIRFAAIAVSLVTSACAYQNPVAPTPTTTATKAEAPSPKAIARLELQPNIAFDAKTVGVLVQGFDDRGNAVDVDATCTTSSGYVSPEHLVGHGAAVGTWREMLPLPGSVTCRSGDREATAAIDLSAWRVELVNYREELTTAQRWQTTVRLNYVSRGGYPAELRSIAWGDGAVDNVTGFVPTTSTQNEMPHTYAGPGDYEIRAVVGWQHGGRAEVRGILTRRCRGAYGPNPVNTPPDPFGICESSFREIH